jgi:hypothetical protein
MVQVESEAIAAEELLTAAKRVMASQPEGLLQSLLRHVQQLFDVPQMEQLPAAMNKVSVAAHAAACVRKCVTRWRSLAFVVG